MISFEVGTMFFQLMVMFLIILFIVSFASFIYGIVKRQKKKVEQHEEIIKRLDHIIELLEKRENK